MEETVRVTLLSVALSRASITGADTMKLEATIMANGRTIVRIIVNFKRLNYSLYFLECYFGKWFNLLLKNVQLNSGCGNKEIFPYFFEVSQIVGNFAPSFRMADILLPY